MTDATTDAKNLTLPTVGGDPNVWGNVLNTTFGQIDTALGGTLEYAIIGDTLLTLTESQNTGYHFTGALTGAANITFPHFQGLAVIRNSAGRALSVGLQGQRVGVPDGATVAAWSDGTDFFDISGDGAAGGASLPVVGNVAPAIPVVGKLWFDTTVFMLKIWTGTWTLVSRLTVIGNAGPTAPITGQLWFDTRLSMLKVFNGTSWTLATALPTVSSSPPAAPQQGLLWYDTSVSTLKVYTGSWVVVSAPGRIRVNGALTFYVSPSGNDSNDGLSPGAPFATLQQPLTVLAANYDLMGTAVVTVRVADGTYAVGATLNGQTLVGSNTVSYVGNLSQPINCKVALTGPGTCFNALFGGNLIVSGFALEAAYGTNGVRFTGLGIGLGASIGGCVTFNNIAFGPVTYSHIAASTAAIVQIGSQYGPYTIYGSAGVAHIAAGGGGSLASIPDARVTLVNTPSFAIGFAYADATSIIYAAGAQFTGAATGRRYYVQNNGVITTNGGGASFFPGSSNGANQSGVYS